MNNFHTIPNVPLDNQLQPSEVSRLLLKDIQRQPSLPGRITEGARKETPKITYSTDTSVTEADMIALAAQFKPFDKSIVVGIPYYSNALHGNYTATLTVQTDTVPLALVWYLGSISRFPALYDYSPNVAQFMGNDRITDVVTANYARYDTSPGAVEICINSYNSPEPAALMGFFRYALYYDDTEVKDLGL